MAYIERGKVIKFDAIKEFSYVRPLGSGGTGETHLFVDNITEMSFAIKKFVPDDQDNKELTFKHFIDEIKILFTISHPNIVRIFNYYLFPDKLTGYIQMEYIDGQSIDQYLTNSLKDQPRIKSIEDLFIETLRGFKYLEDNSILHRDIRNSNIMVDNNHNIKIIDFGFGKVLSANKINNSIILNWPATNHAEEIQKKGVYNHSTEIYYIVILFSKLVEENSILFKFQNILEKMCQITSESRYASFNDILFDIDNHFYIQMDFKDHQKQQYEALANNLFKIINTINYGYEFITDQNKILSGVERVIEENILSTTIQNNVTLIDAFISGSYNYYQYSIDTTVVVEFHNMLLQLSEVKRDIVIRNLIARLSSIEIRFQEDQLPF